MPRNDAKKEDQAAARVLQGLLDGSALLPYLPSEPNHAAAQVAATIASSEALDRLGRVYSIEKWDAETFHRVFLDRAVRAWHGGDLNVEERGHDIIVTSGSCPLEAERARDARVCQTCRAFHVHAAARAAPGELRSATHTLSLGTGDATCRATFTLER